MSNNLPTDKQMELAKTMAIQEALELVIMRYELSKEKEAILDMFSKHYQYNLRIFVAEIEKENGIQS